MKTFIYVRESDLAVMGVGMIYLPDGNLTDGPKQLVQQLGEDAGIIAWANKHKPTGCIARVVSTADLPGNGLPDATYDKTFFGAVEINADGTATEHRGWTDALPGAQVDVDLPVAKSITHMRRRAKRAEEFKPLDEIISKNIPGTDLTAAEANRQAVRDRYAVMQTDIDSATTADELKTVIEIEGI